MRSDGSSSEQGPSAEQLVLEVFQRHLSPIMSRCVLRFALSAVKADLNRLSAAQVEPLLEELQRGLRLYAPETASDSMSQLRPIVESLASPTGRRALMLRVNGSEPPGGAEATLPAGPVTYRIESEADIVLARHAARELCTRIGFSRPEETKAATVISELARNIVQYAGRGAITIRRWNDSRRVGIEIRAKDQGPGIPHLDVVLSGTYRSKTGLGLGIVGTKRLAYQFEITSVVGQGTEIVARMVMR